MCGKRLLSSSAPLLVEHKHLIRTTEVFVSKLLLIESISQSNYFIVRLKVDQRAGQLSLPHLGITKTEKIELKHKTDEQISPVNSLEPRDQSDGQKQTR